MCAWGIFKKLKNAVKKVGKAIGGGIKKIFNAGKKAINSDTFKGLMNTGTKLAPVIGAGISSAMGGSPSEGMKIGHVVQGLGNSLGYG